jgi:hypothetical protein
LPEDWEAFGPTHPFSETLVGINEPAMAYYFVTFGTPAVWRSVSPITGRICRSFCGLFANQ